MNVIVARLRDITAMLLIGDGVAAMVAPHARPEIWKAGPSPWKDLMEVFENRPRAVIAVGALEAIIGILMVRRIADESHDGFDDETPEIGHVRSGPGSHG